MPYDAARIGSNTMIAGIEGNKALEIRLIDRVDPGMQDCLGR
jgi:hypothetical protein